MTQHGFQIRTALGLDVLADDLASWLEAEPLPPMQPETVLVQSQGMRRWLELNLADRLGCAANLEMPFPGTFFRRLADPEDDATEAGRTELSPFGPEVLTWRIERLLHTLVDRPSFALVRAYLQDEDPRKRYQLCRRIAEAMDRYQVYRPDVLARWRTGRGNPDGHDLWQAELWRTLCDETDAEPLSEQLVQMIETLRRGGPPPVGLPPRLVVFGMTSLAPIFIDLLEAMAAHLPVRVYVVVSGCSDEDEDARHPLSESMGGQCREFLSLLRRGGRHQEVHLEDKRTRPSSLLGRLQEDIITGRHGDQAPPVVDLPRGDASLHVHVCHSPMREMEVLHDSLLDAFEKDPSLRPWDVVVMMPDVAGYAPYINAVFSAHHADVPHIRYRIADRPRRAEEAVIDAFLDVLELAGRRVGATEVMDLLESDPVREAAGLGRGELPTVRDWLVRTGVHWGLDGPYRQRSFDIPDDPRGTWRWALERLVMGHATGTTECLVDGVLPVAGALGGASDLVGRVVHWLQGLFGWLEVLETPAPPAEWAHRLAEMGTRLLAGPGGSEEDVDSMIQQQALALTRLAEAAGSSNPVPLAMVREHLCQVVETSGLPSNFINGGVTFCGLKPMRTVPFKMVALCGMDGDAFPRQEVLPEFDLAGRTTRSGDRKRRQDDRQLFLDTLLAAGSRLHLSYVGRSIRDNQPRAASVCIDELLDVLRQSYPSVQPDDHPEPRPVQKLVTVEHHLQPFNPAYFDGHDDRLFSYASQNCRAGQLDASGHHDVEPFVTGPLEVEPPVQVGLRELTDFWLNPCKAYCRYTLQLVLPVDEQALDDDQPMTLSGLAAYQATARMVDHRVRGQVSPENEAEVLPVEFDYPPGQLGCICHQQVLARAERFADGLKACRLLPPVNLVIEGPETDRPRWTLDGELDGLTPEGLLCYRPGKLSARDRMRAWLGHLVLCACRLPEGVDVPRRTTLVAEDAREVLGPVDDAHERLSELVQLMWRGLNEPLRFFIRTSCNLVDPACDTHAKQWGNWSSDYAPGDADDPYVQLCFRGCLDPADICTDAMQQLARTVWQPYFKALGDGGQA